MPRIQRMFAFVMEDQGPDDEGVAAFFEEPYGWMPMVGADLERIESLTPKAQGIANQEKKTIRVLEFELKGELKKIVPQ